MAFKKYNTLDLGTAQLDQDISPTSSTIPLRNIENIPESNFILTIRVSSGWLISKNERIYVGTRTGNVLSGVIRWYAGSTAKSFESGDDVMLNIVAEHITDIQDEIESKASVSYVDSEIQNTKDLILGWASSAYDTLLELQNEIQNNDGDISWVLATLSGKAQLSGGNGFSWKQNVALEHGSINQDYASNYVQLNIRPNSGKYGFLSFSENGVADRWSIWIKPWDGNLYIWTSYPSGINNKVVIANNWNFWIWTTNPQAKLDVHWNINTLLYNSFNEVKHNNPDGFAGVIFRNDAWSRWVMFQNWSTRAVDGWANAFVIRNDFWPLELWTYWQETRIKWILKIQWSEITWAWNNWTPAYANLTATAYCRYKRVWNICHIQWELHVNADNMSWFEFSFWWLPFSVNGKTVVICRMRQWNLLRTATVELVGTWGYVSLHTPENDFTNYSGIWLVIFSWTYEIY